MVVEGVFKLQKKHQGKNKQKQAATAQANTGGAGWENISGTEQERMTTSLPQTMEYMKQHLAPDVSFDVVYRVIEVGGRQACIYFIDGFCKDDLMMKILQYFIDIKPEDMPGSAYEMAKKSAPYVEVDLKDQWDDIIHNILSGVFALFIDGFDRCVLIDARTYPARSVEEPDKDKTLRGSKDGFVETIVFNTALIRRRIRSSELRMEMMNAGKSSQTDIVLCYMDNRVDHEFLDSIKRKIEDIKVDALTMNQESLAECLYQRKWFNPFPKFKFTERPDVAAAQVLEGDIVILVDNSPSAMIIPTSIFDILEEADDYYFPPVTGTYLRLSRLIISILTYIMTPTFLLLMMYPQWVPEAFQFIMIKETVNIPLVFQFLILELAIDGLKLAAVNTPNMLSTPLSVMAALVLGEFSVNSGWFNSEVMLYMAFVALANYTQQNYEFGYALKFMRIINLILTAMFGIYGYIAAVLIFVISIARNKTLSDKSYIYPLIPFHFKQLMKRLLRMRLPEAKK
jgi:stage V sporulation protein AF